MTASNVANAATDPLSTAKILEAFSLLRIPKVITPMYCISQKTRDALDAISSESPPVFPTFLASPFWVMPDQKRDVWVFNDHAIARHYIDGHIKEETLEKFNAAVAASSNLLADH